MIRIDKKDFEQTTSECIEKVRGGETIMITDQQEPLAEMRPAAATAQPQQFPLGFAKGLISIDARFWEPLPDHELKHWYGE